MLATIYAGLNKLSVNIVFHLIQVADLQTRLLISARLRICCLLLRRTPAHCTPSATWLEVDVQTRHFQFTIYNAVVNKHFCRLRIICIQEVFVFPNYGHISRQFTISAQLNMLTVVSVVWGITR